MPAVASSATSGARHLASEPLSLTAASSAWSASLISTPPASLARRRGWIPRIPTRCGTCAAPLPARG